MKTGKKPTYISLFSSAGVGCYGFKLEAFDCIATNELIARRLDVQRFNQKCKYESGYICGDITEEATKTSLYEQIDLWKKEEQLTRVDVVIATPPCQGMSVANHKKHDDEIVRNSLVVESLKLIEQIHPRFFVLENVPAFMRTACTDVDQKIKTIGEAIEKHLGADYSYAARVINFKNYGACSSRQRTLVIGVCKDLSDEISPLELFPKMQKEQTLRQTIGQMKPLREYGEIDESDIYHSFRMYPEHMRAWISDLKEGESAFDNADNSKKPHQVIGGEIVVNQRKNGDKYTRQYWDKVGPCIHTRNDQLASQNTIHPSDDRVFSIRELMRMMSVPDSFRWTSRAVDELNRMPLEQKREFLKKEEIKIRQSLGEAVPTAIFRAIAEKIKAALQYQPLSTAAINKLVSECALSEAKKLQTFIRDNPMRLSPASLGRVAELANTSRTDHAAYFTGKTLITEMMKALPNTDSQTVRILEPSVGVGNFIPLLLKKFEGKQIQLDVMDIDADSLEAAKLILRGYPIPDTCTIRYLNADFLLYPFQAKYDYIIGNPPFYKLKSSDDRLAVYRKGAVNQNTTNLCSFFLDKAMQIGNYVAMVFPKFLLNTPEFAVTRDRLSQKAVDCILDFGEKGFPGVLVETLAVFINNLGRPSRTRVVSVTRGMEMLQRQNYIFDKKLPYWVIYRDEAFDNVCKKLDFAVFDVFRDRQITNQMLTEQGEIRVLKARNISDDGTRIEDILHYDSYISKKEAAGLNVYAYLNADDVYLTPNMTYKPRMMKKPNGCLVNGSVAILLPKDGVCSTDAQMKYIASQEYRTFYQTARNYQTRSLNVDACSVFFYGLLRSTEKTEPITEAFSETGASSAAKARSTVETQRAVKAQDEASTEQAQLQPTDKGRLSVMTQQELQVFCNQHNYDLRKSHNARWIDQKCTPDVLWSVSDFVLNFVDNVSDCFTVKDIWESEYAKQTIAETYSKPGTDERKAENEYDKVFAQPLSMLCYAGVLADVSATSRHRYRIANREVLEYIARNDVYALRFLQCYIEKVLCDSGLMILFENFFEHQDKAHFNQLKQKFIDFYHVYTPVNGDFEPKRIFTKVLNPLAFSRGKRGTERGRLSPHRINRSDMMYNQDNFRDVYCGKPKEMTRQEWLTLHPEIEVRDGYFEQMMPRAKRTLRDFNERYRANASELSRFVAGHDDTAAATQAHHIFPRTEYPEIMHYVENMIMLTPNQHYSFAHPNNNTHAIDMDAQRVLLLAKLGSIRQNLTSETEEQIFAFRDFLRVLRIGWDDESVLEIADGDYERVIGAINCHYLA